MSQTLKVKGRFDGPYETVWDATITLVRHDDGDDWEVDDVEGPTVDHSVADYIAETVDANDLAAKAEADAANSAGDRIREGA